jgi:hypothetical protein
VLGRSAARRRADGLGGAGEVEEVRALRVVELQRAGQGVEDACGGAGEVAAFQARVAGDADSGEDSDLLAAQAREPARAVVGQADIGRLEPGAAGGQELADLVARVPSPHQRRRAPAGVGNPARVTFTGFLRTVESVVP